MTTVNGGKLSLRSQEIRVPMPWGFIAGKSWGEPTSGVPVLGLHGWRDNAGTFDRIVPLLPPSFYFVAIDVQGHGFSSHLPPGMPYHLMDVMLVLRRVVAFLGWTKFSIIGHSLGAGMGALFASLYPSEVETLVMIDLAKPIANDGSNPGRAISSAVNAFLANEKRGTQQSVYTYFEALERMRQATENAISEDESKILMVRGSRQVDEDEYSFTLDPRVACPQLNQLNPQDCFEILKQIRCRLLFIKAKDGLKVQGKEEIDQALSIYRSNCAEFKEVVVDGNHFIHLNNPHCVAEHINLFFKGL